MKALDTLPIEKKLSRMSLLASGAALLLTSASLITFDVITFDRSLATRLTAFADIVGNTSASAVLFNDAAAADRNLAAMASQASITEAALYTPQGQLFAH